ncbi:quinone oxidoreductase, partial [Morganella morganii]|nr:quinone oxidoreductase [Morganella morganii]
MAKRIGVDAPGGTDVLVYRDFTPADPAPGGVQVDNKAIGVSYVETSCRSGLYPAPVSPS